MITRSQLLGAAAAAAIACAPGSPARAAGPVRIVGAENFYADIASAVAGPAATVTAILSNPNTDPHAYEPTTDAAAAVGSADIVVENGLGYDAFVPKLLAASPNAARTTIVAGDLAGKRTGDNPHVWYLPAADLAVANAVASALERRVPAQAKAIERRRAAFARSLEPWTRGIAAIRARDRGAHVIVTEPVFDYVLDAAGLRVMTPESYRLAVEDGNDPAPQDVARMAALAADPATRALAYNRQTVEPATTRLLAAATAARLPVVPVTETMPLGTHFAAWMRSQVAALARAIEARR